MGIERYKTADNKDFKLADYSTGPGKNPLYEKSERAKILEKNREEMRAYQDKLYADGKAGLLIIFQGIDGGGKDSAIRT